MGVPSRVANSPRPVTVLTLGLPVDEWKTENFDERAWVARPKIA